jgi:uncharacterized protein (TIGR02271 family)
LTNIDSRELSNWVGRTAVDRDGDKVGKIADVYLDDDTGQPEWLAVTTGMFGTGVSFVPLRGASASGDDVVIGWDKATVKDAPRCEADGQLSPEEEERLYQYYGAGDDQTDVGRRTDAGRETVGRETVGRDTSGPTTDDAMTRSEEEVRVDKRTQEAGRARLRKWVETDQVQMTVPVQREKAALVTEPITDANRDAAVSGPDLSEEEHEVVLSEEVVDVQKRTVPKERVRLETETVTEDVPVSEEVRKERIEVEGEDEVRRTR